VRSDDGSVHARCKGPSSSDEVDSEIEASTSAAFCGDELPAQNRGSRGV
jgi:hypothetical protein